MGLRYRLATVAGWVRMFSNPRDYVRFKRFMAANAAGTSGEFHVRGMSGTPLTCRGGTSDAIVLRDTFAGQYHVPTHRPRPPVILDLGANAGYVAAHYAKLYPDARIISVEMDSGNAAQCRRHTEEFGPRCTVVEAAIWTEDGDITYGGSDQSAFSITDAAERDDAQRVAKAISLDSLLSEHEIDQIGFMKMDIEGAEGPVLRTGGEWLRKTRAIQVEIHPPVTVEEIETILKAHGFAVSRHPRHWSSVNGERLDRADRKASGNPPAHREKHG